MHCTDPVGWQGVQTSSLRIDQELDMFHVLMNVLTKLSLDKYVGRRHMRHHNIQGVLWQVVQESQRSDWRYKCSAS